ncbi:hypothetical protein [Aquabacterium sp.]|uniref:hypothetical protein n=1 Tax=Aquabacterium sp. TaxID=1872578 RepID=UPI0035ADB04D
MTSISSSTLNVSSYSSMQGASGAHGPGRHKPDFSKLDTDGDGSISQTELEAGKPQGESSNNGMSQMGLSTSDFAQMMGAQGGMQMQGPPPGPPPDGEGEGSSGTDASGTSGTSSTSGSSASDQLGKLFDAIDSDGNGSLSSSEVSDFRQKMQDIFSSLGQQMQHHGGQQDQWFSQDGGTSTQASNTISYNA